MQTILITGGAGNIGSALAHKLVQQKTNLVVVVDNLFTGSLHKLPESDNLKFIKADVNNYKNLKSVLNGYNFDFIFHYAAVVGVQRTLSNPIQVLNDIEGIKNILNLALQNSVKRIFFSSSSEVYGEPFEFPQSEQTTPLNSRLPYAIVKNVGEAFFRSFQKEYGLDYTIFRFFNTYGENQSKDFVIPRFIFAATKDKPIEIYGDGSQSRTFCYVQDNVDVTIKAMVSESCRNDLLNVGSDVEVSILQLAEKIISLTNSRSEIRFLPALKEGDMTRRCPDIKKMKKILNRDLISLDSGLKKLIALYEDR